MIAKGQYVKIIFRNSTQAEGFVDSWENNVAVLMSEDRKSKMIVTSISSDVMAIKVSLDKELPAEIPQTQTKRSKLEELQDSFEELKESPSSNDLRTKNLAELKKLIIIEEKNAIRDKIKYHYPSSGIGTQYGNPFIKKPSSK